MTIRRLDDLGRLSFPKEIRKAAMFTDNESVEISVEQDRIVIKKFRPLNNMESAATPVLNALRKYYRLPVVMCDRTGVICAAGTVIPPETKYGENFVPYINGGEYIYCSGIPELYIDGGGKYKAAALVPVMSLSEPCKCIGSLILLCMFCSVKVPKLKSLDPLRFAAMLIAEQAII